MVTTVKTAVTTASETLGVDNRDGTGRGEDFTGEIGTGESLQDKAKFHSHTFIPVRAKVCLVNSRPYPWNLHPVPSRLVSIVCPLVFEDVNTGNDDSNVSSAVRPRAR